MVHMLSCFNLPDSESIESYVTGYRAFVAEMQTIGLLESSGPIGRRHADTPMDTDDERDHEFFVIMSFRDRAQVDAAYDHILRHLGAGCDAHAGVKLPVSDPVFICWEDLPATD